MREPYDALLFGATGPVGRALLERLTAAGGRVVAVSRAPPAGRDGVLWHRYDLYAGDGPEPPAAAIVYGAGPLDGLADWCRRRPPAPGTRIVALSSTSAVSKRESADAGERELARRLLESERALLELGAARDLAVTLLRPTLIYGHGADRSLARLAALARRLGGVPLPATATGRRQPVHADDLAAAMLECARRPDLAGAALTLPGGETLGYREMVQRYLDAHAPGRRVWPLPAWAGFVAERLLASGPCAWRTRARQLARTREDLLFPDEDWQRLGLRPRRFLPEAG